MKRRTWFKAVAAAGVAVMFPWVKRAKAVDQVVRISGLRRRIGFGWACGEKSERADRLSVIQCGDDAVEVICDATHPDEDGKYSSAAVAITKRMAQTMDDDTLCQKLWEGLLLSAMRDHRLGLFDLGPPPEWIT
jgi:hypothetical protein